MRRLSIALIAAASTAAFTEIASAADVPVRARVYPSGVQAPYNWTGFYIGGNAGYGWGQADARYVAPGPPNGLLLADQAAVSAHGSAALKPKGFVGGAQIGYNYQFAPTWILGFEADFQAFNLSDSFEGTFFTPPGNQQISQTKVDADWLFTLRGRLGYAVDRWLIYGTGGLAVAKINFEQVNSLPDYPFTDDFSVSKTRTGWTVGGGFEYAFQNQWSVKAEYLYVDLGNISGTSATVVLNPAVPVSFGHDTDFRAHIVRGGINYRFN